jgi:hypothetical protein
MSYGEDFCPGHRLRTLFLFSDADPLFELGLSEAQARALHALSVHR